MELPAIGLARLDLRSRRTTDGNVNRSSVVDDEQRLVGEVRELGVEVVLDHRDGVDKGGKGHLVRYCDLNGCRYWHARKLVAKLQVHPGGGWQKGKHGISLCWAIEISRVQCYTRLLRVSIL